MSDREVLDDKKMTEDYSIGPDPGINMILDENDSEDMEPDIFADFANLVRKNGNGDDDDDMDDDEKEKSKMELFDWMQCVVSAIICGIFIFVFIGRTIGVEGDSMMHTLHWNDRVIMSGIFYTPKNGDIVIFRPPTDAFGSAPLVKRVIAVGGQTVDIDFELGEVYVDGELEHYVDEPTYSRLNFSGPVTVPEGHVFVLGDNRNRSSDSRDSRVGMVDTRYILGKVLFLLIPGENGSGKRDWSRIGLIT